jgi:hypothetical protein
MALVNQAEREEKQVKKLLSQIKKAIKEAFPHHGEIEHWKDSEGVHHITVENGLGWVTRTAFAGFSGVMRDFVRESEFATYIGHGEKAGEYMWDAKVYIKDSSWVTFKI